MILNFNGVNINIGQFDTIPYICSQCNSESNNFEVKQTTHSKITFCRLILNFAQKIQKYLSILRETQ